MSAPALNNVSSDIIWAIVRMFHPFSKRTVLSGAMELRTNFSTISTDQDLKLNVICAGDNHCFLSKSRRNGGAQFSSDPLNLTNKNTRKVCAPDSDISICDGTVSLTQLIARWFRQRQGITIYYEHDFEHEQILNCGSLGHRCHPRREGRSYHPEQDHQELYQARQGLLQDQHLWRQVHPQVSADSVGRCATATAFG